MVTSTLRQRRPTTSRTDSCPVISSTDRRPRSYSLHEASYYSRNAFEYGSSLLQSLDLPASFVSIKDFLAGKLEEAEQGLRALREYVEDGEAEEELIKTSHESLEEGSEGEEDEHEAGHEGKLGSETTRRASTEGDKEKEQLSRTPGGGGGRLDDEEIEAEIHSLEQFIESASSFLSDIRDELPILADDLSGPSSGSLISFQLSDDAREALDQFLADHPLPSLPRFDVAASSANALLLRVTNELRTLKDALTSLSSPTPSDPASSSVGMSSFFRSLPPMPSPVPDFSDLRSYFSTESTRLKGAARHLKEETAESLQAGLHHLSDGAAELSAYVKDHSSHAIDEATRMYHKALEIGKTRLLQYQELPLEWRNNEFIISGYRYIPIEQWGMLLRSGWEWHNETVNIQSHFLGFLSLVGLLVYYLTTTPSYSTSASSLAEVTARPGDTAIAVLFVTAAMKCLLSSAVWHLLAGCATSSWFQGAACLDYVGISSLIAASVMAAEYYGFYHHANLATGYMIFSALVGITGMIVPWSAWFNQREYKAYRIAFFVALAASAIAPVTHRALLEGFFDTLWFYSPAIPSVLSYLFGLVFYAHQFPECCAPGDWNWGNSHNWWHCAIVVAVWLQWRAIAIWSVEVHLPIL
ncbi:hemolysin III family protein [Sporobolomyces salmoneus]|uniref:hemolysin III family protein n=1 Tax=Sporobolomyces salmoneus TaxID=183962 RepID=UPI00317B6F7C